MSFRVRRVQNRPKRETNEIKSAELQDLRKENQKLKREVARLRRQIDKTISFVPEKEEIVGPLKKEKENLCPSCGSNQLTQLQFSVKVITICKNCKWRKAA